MQNISSGPYEKSNQAVFPLESVSTDCQSLLPAEEGNQMECHTSVMLDSQKQDTKQTSTPVDRHPVKQDTPRSKTQFSSRLSLIRIQVLYKPQYVLLVFNNLWAC